MELTPLPTPALRGARTYILEGEIAAGKSALAQALAEALRSRGRRVCVVLEPVDQWREIGILQKFYGDPARFGYSFQTYVFATRVLEIARAINADPHADVYLLERSPATDQIFMELQRGMVDPVEMKMYADWCATFHSLLPLDFTHATVLYLKTSIGHCMRRLAQRQREGEMLDEASSKTDASAAGGVSVEYQERLRRAHEAFFLGQHAEEFPHLPKSPFPLSSIIELGPELADGNFRDAGLERDQIIEAIIEKMPRLARWIREASEAGEAREVPAWS